MAAAAPKVIVSFDCEGRWGVADHLSDDLRMRLRNRNLTAAYGDLVQLLSDNGIDATFAFSAAVLMTNEQARKNRQRFESRTYKGQNFAGEFLKDLDKDTDGWLCPELIDIVRGTDRTHEIACHGFSHLPWEEHHSDEASLDDELRFAADVFDSYDVKPKTFIYPRNKIYATHLLKKHGYLGYRRDDDPSRRGGTSIVNKVANKLSDDLFRMSGAKTDWQISSSTGLVEISAGYFIPWRVGYRRAVPLGLSERGFRRTFEAAIKQSRVLHLWIHPWNIIGSPETKALFSRCIEAIGAAASRGEVSVVTQQDFCIWAADKPS